jgi:hypothetical protein
MANAKNGEWQMPNGEWRMPMPKLNNQTSSALVIRHSTFRLAA